MITNCEPLLDALRNEVLEYGGLLHLFGRQQDAILGRDPDRVLAVTSTIESQIETIDSRRKARESLVKECAVEAYQPSANSLKELLPFFSEPIRPLLEALMDEINNLITRTKRRASQNQMLLARSIEISQEILERLNPQGIVKTYSNRGQVRIKLSKGAPRDYATTI